MYMNTTYLSNTQAFFERVQAFATTAWGGCQASGWQPALVMVQNKWHYSEEDPAVDITDQFSAHVDRDKTLGSIFTSVSTNRGRGEGNIVEKQTLEIEIYRERLRRSSNTSEMTRFKNDVARQLTRCYAIGFSLCTYLLFT